MKTLSLITIATLISLNAFACEILFNKYAGKSGSYNLKVADTYLKLSDKEAAVLAPKCTLTKMTAAQHYDSDTDKKIANLIAKNKKNKEIAADLAAGK